MIKTITRSRRRGEGKAPVGSGRGSRVVRLACAPSFLRGDILKSKVACLRRDLSLRSPCRPVSGHETVAVLRLSCPLGEEQSTWASVWGGFPQLIFYVRPDVGPDFVCLMFPRPDHVLLVDSEPGGVTADG